MTDNQFLVLAVLLVFLATLLGYALGGFLWAAVGGAVGYCLAMLLDFLPPA